MWSFNYGRAQIALSVGGNVSNNYCLFMYMWLVYRHSESCHCCYHTTSVSSPATGSHSASDVWKYFWKDSSSVSSISSPCHKALAYCGGMSNLSPAQAGYYISPNIPSSFTVKQWMLEWGISPFVPPLCTDLYHWL